MFSLLAGVLGFEAEALTDRIKRTLIVNTIMGALALVGLLLLIVAGVLALSEVVGPVLATLYAAGVFLVLAFAVYLGTVINAGRRRRDINSKRRSSETGALLTTAAITALPVLLRSPIIRTMGLPAAALAAYLFLRKDDGSDA